MDRTVPVGATLLLDFIRSIEVGTDARAGYDVIYAHRQDRLPKPITQMRVAELQDHQRRGWPAKSTASGGYQLMRKTLGGLRTELGLRDGQIFDPDLQDRLAYHLLKRRGYEEFMAGKIGVTEFGKRLAMEWASLPVLAATKGAHRTLKRGQSYYEGDALNKALIDPERVEKLLAQVRAAGIAAEKPTNEREPSPAPSHPPAPDRAPAPVSAGVAALIAAGLAAIGAAAVAGWDRIVEFFTF